MKYAVIKTVNGSFAVVNEDTDINMAIVHFHSACVTLWNSKDVEKATVKLVNEKLETIKVEYIKYSEEV